MKPDTNTRFYQSLPCIPTARLRLRKAHLDDAAAIYRYSSDEEVTRYLRWGPHKGLSQTEAYLKGVVAGYAEGEDGPWLIEEKQEMSVIGHVHLMDLSTAHSKAEVGIVLATRFQHRGYATEALKAVLTFAFDRLGLNRVEGLCVRENRAAARMMERAGMAREGILRGYYMQKGVFQDMAVHAILRDRSLGM